MSSDSSSSDEQISRLNEEIDTISLGDDLHKNGITKEKDDDNTKPLPSLRDKKQDIVTNSPFSVKVTPEFQEYVSEHLSKLLDKTIDDTEVFLKVKKHRTKHVDSGIKLLLTSKQFLNPANSIESYGHVRKRRKVTKEEIDYEARAKEAAVTSEWVLSKKEVQSWASSWKNNVEVVKLSNDKKKKKKEK